jgi:hypothetical protein
MQFQAAGARGEMQYRCAQSADPVAEAGRSEVYAEWLGKLQEAAREGITAVYGLHSIIGT